MEITDNPLGAIEIIELDDPQDQTEVEDAPAQKLLPGSLGPMLDALSGDDEASNDDAEEKETDWENDGDHGKFMFHVRRKLDNIPRHSGSTTVGCEKAIAFLKRLDREISKAIQSDEDNVIDEHEAEGIRDTIMEFVDQLEGAHEKLMGGKRKKKASVWVGKEVVARLNDGADIQYFLPVIKDEVEELVRVALTEPEDDQVQKFVEGEKQLGMKKEAHTAHISLYVDPFMQSITRILINSHVSAGRNIEDVYKHLDKKYSFTNREKLGIQEVLMQKGFPIFKDFGLDGEEMSPFTGKGIEFLTTYPGN